MVRYRMIEGCVYDSETFRPCDEVDVHVDAAPCPSLRVKPTSRGFVPVT